MAEQNDDRKDEQIEGEDEHQEPILPSLEEENARLKAELEKKDKVLKQTQAESIKHRQTAQKLKEWEEAEARKKEAALSDEEKRRREAAEDKARLRDLENSLEEMKKQRVEDRINRAIESAARKVDFRRPEHAPYQPEIRREVAIDPDTDEVTGADEAVKKFLKQYPDYAGDPGQRGTPPRDGSPVRRPVGQASVNVPDPRAELSRSIQQHVQFTPLG